MVPLWKLFWSYLLKLEILFLCCYCIVVQSCATLCNPMDCSIPSFPVLHNFLDFAHTHVYWAGDAIQPSHPLSSPSPHALNLSQHTWFGQGHPLHFVTRAAICKKHLLFAQPGPSCFLSWTYLISILPARNQSLWKFDRLGQSHTAGNRDARLW